MTARVGIEERGANAAAVVALARTAVEAYVEEREPPEAPAGNALLERKAGAFVSIHTTVGELRGCIGTVDPREQDLGREIVRNAVAASQDDPRFSPVRARELEGLTYKVDVLEAPEAVGDESALDPAHYGVIVESWRRRGLLLPALEGIDRAEDQVRIAREKGGIGANEPVSLFRFRVTRYEEGAERPVTP